VFDGIDSEFDASRYPRDFGQGANHKHDESIISQYFDFQFRPFEKLYSTFGLRSDRHSTVGRKTSGRTTVAYQLNGNSKIRSSLGAGVRFPALYDYAYGYSTIVDKDGTLEELQSERGLSFDLGYDIYLNNLDLGLSTTLFKTKQKNSILNNARTEWVQMNATGINTSQGIELSGYWKPVDKKISLNFGYTFTDSYDAATCDPDEMNSYLDGECHDRGSKVDSAKVRVPRHAIHHQGKNSFHRGHK
jgi:outer membrane receptor for ferrienterochelin and colicin